MTPDARLAALSDASIALVLGVCVGQPQKVANMGRVSVLVDELQRRGVYHQILATLDSELAAAITILDRADRGQRWARTGRR